MSQKLLVVMVAIGSSVLNVVCDYAPQVGRSNEEKEEFLIMFGKTLDGISEMERLVVGGDFNAMLALPLRAMKGSMVVMLLDSLMWRVRCCWRWLVRWDWCGQHVV